MIVRRSSRPSSSHSSHSCQSTNIAAAGGSLEATGTIEESTILATTGESQGLTAVQQAAGAIEQSTKAGGAIEQSTGELWSTIAVSGASEGLAAVQEAAGACEEPTDMESLGSDIPAGFVIVNSRTLYDVSHRHTHTGHRDVRGRVCQVM
jgi:hypothetical protein